MQEFLKAGVATLGTYWVLSAAFNWTAFNGPIPLIDAEAHELVPMLLAVGVLYLVWQ